MAESHTKLPTAGASGKLKESYVDHETGTNSGHNGQIIIKIRRREASFRSLADELEQSQLLESVASRVYGERLANLNNFKRRRVVRIVNSL